MKQRKQQPKPLKNQSLEAFFNSYDSVTVISLINTFEQSQAWEVFKAYASTVQRRYEVEALDRAGKDGTEKAAAYASGYAKACEDLKHNFMEGLKQTALNVSPVVENNRTEEAEPSTQYD